MSCVLSFSLSLSLTSCFSFCRGITLTADLLLLLDRMSRLETQKESSLLFFCCSSCYLFPLSRFIRCYCCCCCWKANSIPSNSICCLHCRILSFIFPFRFFARGRWSGNSLMAFNSDESRRSNANRVHHRQSVDWRDGLERKKVGHCCHRWNSLKPWVMWSQATIDGCFLPSGRLLGLFLSSAFRRVIGCEGLVRDKSRETSMKTKDSCFA